MSGLKFLKKAVITISKAAQKMPEDYGRTVAAGMGTLVYLLWRSERFRIVETIDRICHRMKRPRYDQLNVLVKRVFIHFSLTIYEIMRMPAMSEEELKTKVTFHGIKNLENALKKGKGVILALPHIGNWELFGAAIAARGYKLNSFYLSQKEDELGGLLDYFRGFSKMRMHDRDRGGIKALKALKAGEILGMVADQDGANQGVYLDFLGHFVSLPAGPANWSIKTGAVLVPIYSLRRGLSNKFDAWFLPGLSENGEGSHRQKVIKRTARLSRWMEKLILNHPDQYLWFYDRFKPRHEKWIASLKQKNGQMFHQTVRYD
ncbi:MAG: lysophospholipid acyltransferase family protein [Candidatus Rifleibacteriota bacterium]